jgi:endo-1,4-beta-xylanase
MKAMKKGKRLFSAILIGVLVLGSIMVPKTETKAANETLLNTYGNVMGRSGNCVTLNQLRDPATLSHIKSHYNSITLENEMKPDAMLGWQPSLISQNAARDLGYYIPSSMQETYVPKINFDTIDQVLKICYENGIGVRAHTLIWHSQTPDWFFRVGYSTNYGYVSESQMNNRMEYYIKTIMNHVYTSKYGSVVYTWDVVNEYLHATPSGWSKIYGNCGNKPAFVKRAFQYAYDCINYFKLTDSVSLMYNDFNTYMEVDNIITMIRYINAEKKICNGVGMQSHLGTTFPSVSYYTAALQAFVNAGFEVQITELDVTNKSDADQAGYLYDLMKNVLRIKKAGGKITGLTWWGISDHVTWIKGEKPLLFSYLNVPKSSYYNVLQAYKDTGFAGGNGSSQTLPNGWYYIKNINAQKYLQVKDNAGGNGVNVEIGTGTGVKGQKWYLSNQGDGYFTLKNGNGYMLDIQYGAKEDGVNVQTYSANGADAQKFKVVKTSEANVYGIVTKVTGDKKSLDVYNFGTADGSNVCQWTYYANSCQKWIFEAC